jgi:hypothetical protein
MVDSEFLGGIWEILNVVSIRVYIATISYTLACGREVLLTQEPTIDIWVSRHCIDQYKKFVLAIGVVFI